MLVNPFTPSEVASNPEDFFGRNSELDTLETSLAVGSVAIQGAIGIGKSSLLARCRLLMEGFGSEHAAKSVIAVGDKDTRTADDAARIILESLVSIDERQRTLKFKIGSFFEAGSSEVCRNFVEGRHLSVLKKVVEQGYLNSTLSNGEFLILAIDEADKCPIPLTQVIRAVATHTQQQGVKRLRFLLSGVSPFFQQMVMEDSGIGRFFYKTINLEPMPDEEAASLMETKLAFVCSEARKANLPVEISTDIVTRVVRLSGGHPHLLQLLGSHLIQHENEDPDNIIDARDLYNSLQRICYEDRGRVYEALIHEVELNGKLEPLTQLLFDVAPKGVPTQIDRQTAASIVDKDAIKWLVDRNILSVTRHGEYGLVDEFLRIRMQFDQEQTEPERSSLEDTIISSADLPSDESANFPDMYSADGYQDNLEGE